MSVEAASAFVFAAAGKYFAVSTPLAVEVAVLPTLLRVPRAPAHMRGLAVMRGQVIPVIDVGLLVGSSEPPIAPRRAVVLEYQSLVAAVSVQSVLGEVPGQGLMGPAEGAAPFLLGPFTAFDQPVFFIDVPAFLRSLTANP